MAVSISENEAVQFELNIEVWTQSVSKQGTLPGSILRSQLFGFLYSQTVAFEYAEIISSPKFFICTEKRVWHQNVQSTVKVYLTSYNSASVKLPGPLVAKILSSLFNCWSG